MFQNWLISKERKNIILQLLELGKIILESFLMKARFQGIFFICPFPCLFFFIFVLSMQYTNNLHLTGFEQLSHGVGSTTLPTEPQPLPYFKTPFRKWLSLNVFIMYLTKN